MAAKARLAMDAEVWQALSDNVSKILVVAKAYDPMFLSEYILRATPTTDEEQSFDVEARELVDRYADDEGGGGAGVPLRPCVSFILLYFLHACE